MFKNFGAFEILIIVAIILLLFGGRKIPELMRGLGQGMSEFKKASKGKEQMPNEAGSDEPRS